MSIPLNSVPADLDGYPFGPFVPEALPTDAPADCDALGDALASGALDGYRREPPTSGVAETDATILAEMHCPSCGRVGLRYVPFTKVIQDAHPVTNQPRTRLTYRAFGRCPACAASVIW